MRIKETYLSGVKYRKSVNKSFVQRRQDSKQPRDPQERNQHRACLDVKSARRQRYQYSKLLLINGAVKSKRHTSRLLVQSSIASARELGRTFRIR